MVFVLYHLPANRLLKSVPFSIVPREKKKERSYRTL